MIKNFKNITNFVSKDEIKKIIPIGIMMFLMLFIYTLTRDLSVIFMQKFAISGGSEIFSTVRLFFVIPVIILSVFIFEIFIDKFGYKKTFYLLILFFALFFITFSLFLFPNYTMLCMNIEKIKFLQDKLPSFLYYFIPCVGNWVFVIFCLISEIWGSLIIPALFWQFAYKITNKNEVKRFFGLYCLIGNLGVIFSGLILKTIVYNCFSNINFSIKLFALLLICFLFCVLLMFLHNVLSKKYLTTKQANIKTIKKEKMGFFKGISFLFKSKYLLMIAFTLFGYGIALDSIELIWNNYIKENLSVNDFCLTMGNLSLLVGILTILFSLISPIIINLFSWKFSALTTPVVIGFGGFLFFVFYILTNFNNLLGLPVNKIVMSWGLITMAISRGIKYALFDTTRNMTYLPLDIDERTKGQATVESIGVRTGKLGASSVGYVLTNVINPGSKLNDHIIVFFGMFSVSVLIWIKSVFSIDKIYKEKSKN